MESRKISPRWIAVGISCDAVYVLLSVTVTVWLFLTLPIDTVVRFDRKLVPSHFGIWIVCIPPLILAIHLRAGIKDARNGKPDSYKALVWMLIYTNVVDLGVIGAQLGLGHLLRSAAHDQ